MPTAYISHARQDQDFVRYLHEAFEKRDKQAWVDYDDILPTADWLTEVYAGIDSSDAFIFVISPDSVTSRYCKLELDYAVEHSKRIVPVWRRDVDDEAVPPELASEQYIFFRENDDFEEAFEALIEAVDTDLEWVHSHTLLLVRAREWEREGKDRSFLLRGKDLEVAEAWLEQASYKEPKPTLLQTKYIYASRRAATRFKSVIILSLCAMIVLLLIVMLLLLVAPDALSVWSLVLGAMVMAGIGGVAGYAIGHNRAPEVHERRATSPEQPDPLMPETLFVSYSHKDWDKFVKPRVVQLRNEGFKVWLDQSHVGGGDRWVAEIEKALNTCERMVLFVSPDSITSPWVQNEYLSFLTQRKSIVPLMCRTAEIPFGLRHLHVLEYEDVGSLVSILKRPPVPAA